jgi:DNA-binding response OmpR family regulator
LSGLIDEKRPPLATEMDSALAIPVRCFRWRVGRMRFGRQDSKASMTKSHILVVAGDASLRAILARWLMAAGYLVELAESAKRAREVVESNGIALVVVAPDGLGGDGLHLARELGGQVEHVMVIEEEAGRTSTARKSQDDGRIPRPLDEQLVLARIKSALATPPIKGPTPDPELLRFEGYTLDAAGRNCVDASGREVSLTRAEFSMLLALARQPGRVLSRDELSLAVTGRVAEADDRSVDVLMSRLRRKIEPDPKTPRIIVTLPGEGYKFTVRPQVIVAAHPVTASPSFPVVAISEAKPAPGHLVAIQDDKPQAQEIAETKALSTMSLRVPQTVLAVVLVAAGLAGLLAWSFRPAVPPGAPSPTAASLPARPQPVVSEEARRTIIFKRMVATMKKDDRFDWRTVERLAIDAGVDEAEAHEILAEHPDEVTIGKSREGKLIARLPKQ